MGIQFLRGNPQAPRGHAIFFARSSRDTRVVYSTYCLVPPIPISFAKYLPPLFAAQIPTEELQGAANIAGMPIPPMLEEGLSVEELEKLAERRDDDLCDIGTVASEEFERMQLASLSSQEYAQSYASYVARAEPVLPAQRGTATQEPKPLDDVDAEELFAAAMPERQKLTELGKLVGMARYALDGHDQTLLSDTRRRMERITNNLAEKYRGAEIVTAATENRQFGARLAELYMSRAYKLLDEEYADIPGIDRAIRELQE
jgi:hypothetical protein